MRVEPINHKVLNFIRLCLFISFFIYLFSSKQQVHDAEMKRPVEALERPASVELTKKVREWVASTNRFMRLVFVRRLEELHESWAVLRDSPPAHEVVKELRSSKLAQGLEFLWQARSDGLHGLPSVVVHFVVGSEQVCAAAGLVEKSYRRLNEGYVAGSVPEVLLNAEGTTPIPLFVVQRGELRRLLEPSWDPPMRLTASEQALVRHDGCLLILARSGCGKTLVVQERISHIIQMSDPRQPEPRQLFIARSTPLCKQVSEKERKKNKSD